MALMHDTKGAVPDFQVVFESAPGLYLILDPDFTIVGASDAYLNATMRTRQELLGLSIFEAFPDNPDDKAATGTSNLRSSLERVLREKKTDTMAIQKYDVRKPESEGGEFEERYWSPINSPVFARKGDETIVSHIIHRVEDVTEFIQLKQKKAEPHGIKKSDFEKMESEVYSSGQEVQRVNKELRKANDALEKKDHELTLLNEKLKQVNQIKTKFFTNVSHELRTPLSIVIGLTSKLLSPRKKGKTKDKQSLEAILSNTKILLKHINDLLDIAKLESGKMEIHYTDVDLVKLVKQIGSYFTAAVKDKKIEWIFDASDSLMLQADQEKILRIILNLFSNAFVFTPAGGKIHCVLREDAKKNQAVIIVSDNGPGIPPQLRKLIFERFYQIEESNVRTKGGTGLGLSIVKDLIDLHQGSISVKESLEGGAEFIVQLPLKAPEDFNVISNEFPTNLLLEELVEEFQVQKPTAEAVKITQKDLDVPTVLVVEDNDHMNRFIRNILKTDYRVETAFNGREGLEKATQNPPDLILTDIMMPEMSGEDLVNELNKNPKLSHIPVIVLTADDAQKTTMLKKGVQDCLIKPFSVEELEVKVSNLLRKQKEIQKTIQFNEDKLRGILEASPNGIIMIDAHGDMILVNEQIEKMFGYSREEILGKPVDILVPERLRKKNPNFVRDFFGKPSLLTLGSTENDLFGLRKDESEFPMEVGLNPMMSEDGIFTICSVIDITQRRKAQKEIEMHNKDLDSFAYIISHDLKAPLRGIGQLTDWLFQDNLSQLTKDGAANLQMLKKRVHRMHNLIEGVLHYSRIGRTHEEKENVDLNELVAEVIDMLNPPANIKVSILTTLPNLRCIKLQIYQVFMNLISNAIQYMDKLKGRIEVNCADDEMYWRFSVKDNGLGIDQKYFEKVFQIFQTLEAKDVVESTGVGLTIAKKIVEYHEGKIWLESTVGEGTTFYFTLPKK